jgi:sulfate adenylyltransferase subunit 1
MLLANEINISLFEKELQARLVWLDEKPANLSVKYHLQVGSRTAFCKINEVKYLIQPEDPLQNIQSSIIVLNSIAVVKIKLANALFLDKFSDNKKNGAFILIDTQTNNTVAVGFVE